jgi:Uma2 family endonuclease
MSAHPQFAPADQMTIEEFLGFTATRPDEERWELIEGVPVLSPSPVEFHQVIASNIVTFLMNAKRRTNASWLPMLGVGTRVPVSPNSLPQPDVFVKDGPATDKPETTDALVLFEVLSPSNTKSDQAWRRKVYASIPNCQHYVTVSLKGIEVTVYDRTNGWKARRESALDAHLDLPSLGVSMPLADIYRYVPMGGVRA